MNRVEDFGSSRVAMSAWKQMIVMVAALVSVLASEALYPAPASAFECCTQVFQGTAATPETCRPCGLLGPFIPPNHPGNLPFPPPPLVMPSQCGDGICTQEESPGCVVDCGGLGGVPVDPEAVDHLAPFRSDPNYQPGTDAAGKLSANERFKSVAVAVVPPGVAPEVRAAGTAQGSERARGQHTEALGEPNLPQESLDLGDALAPRVQPRVVPIRVLPQGQGGLELRGLGSEDHDRAERDVEENENTDPVHPGTGELRLERTDLALSGVGVPFVFQRVYGSRLDYDGPLGFGWTHSYDQRLVDEPASCDTRIRRWTTGDGGVVTFVSDGGGPWLATPFGEHRLSEQTNGTFVLIHPDGLRSTFATDGTLAEIRDANDNVMTFTWAPGPGLGGFIPRLFEVRDTVGRTIELTYDPRGYLESLSVPALGVSVLYEVDVHGDLARVHGAGRETGGGGEAYEYLSGFSGGSEYVPTPQLESVCEAACSQEADSCNGMTECAWAEYRATQDCVDECFDPESCLATCGACAEWCASTEASQDCFAGPEGCFEVCRGGCFVGAVDDCERRSEPPPNPCPVIAVPGFCPRVVLEAAYSTTDEDNFHRECAKACAESSRQACAATLVCHRLAWTVSAGSEPDDWDVGATPEGYCFGWQGCYDARWVKLPEAEDLSPEDWLIEGLQPGHGLACGPVGAYSIPCEPDSLGALSTSCDRDCFECAMGGSGCPQGSRAGGNSCTERCVEIMGSACDRYADPSCVDGCDVGCHERCSGLCTAGCQSQCERECQSPAQCQTMCRAAAQGYAVRCEDQCRSTCRQALAPPGPRFGRLSDLEHNLLRVRPLRYDGGVGVLSDVMLVENVYETDPASPSFDRVVVHDFGSGSTELSYYDLDHLAAGPIDAQDQVMVESAPTAVVLCGADCLLTEPHPKAGLWLAVHGGEHLVFPGRLPNEPDLGPLEMPSVMEVHRWYELEGSVDHATLRPSTAVPADGIRLWTQEGIVTIAPRVGGGVRMTGLGSEAFDRLLGDHANVALSLVRTRDKGWTAVAGRATRVVRTSPADACAGSFWLEEPAGEASGRVFPEDACSGAVRFEELGRTQSHGPDDGATELGLGVSWRFQQGRAHAEGGLVSIDPCFELALPFLDPICDAALEMFGDPAPGADPFPNCGSHWAVRGLGPDLPEPPLGTPGFGLGIECLGGEVPVMPPTSCEPDDYEPAYEVAHGHSAQPIARATVVRSGAGVAWTYYADRGGRVLRVVNSGSGTAVDRNFDGKGRLIGERTALGDRTCHLYSPQGDVVQTTWLPAPDRWSAQDRIVQRYQWLPERRLQTVFDPNDPTVPALQMGYDARGNLTTLAQPELGLATSLVRDARGRVVEEVSPDGTRTRVTLFSAATGVPTQVVKNYGSSDEAQQLTLLRDGFGRLRRFDSPGRPPMEWTYSPDGRLLESRVHLEPGAPPLVTITRYDGIGRVHEIEGPTSTQRLTLSDRGLLRVAEELANDGSLAPRTRCFAYDDRGRVTELVDPEGRRTRFVRDVHGLVQQVIRGVWPSLPSPGQAGWDAECASNFAGGTPMISETVLSMTRDAAGMLVRVERGEPNALDPWTTRYVYDGFGRRVEEVLPDGSRARRAYDAAGRVVWSATHRPGRSDLPDGLVGAAPFNTDPTLVSMSRYEWDALGRPKRQRALWFEDDATGGRTFPGTSNWLDTEVTYDDALRLTEVTGPDGSTTRIQQDALGREVNRWLADGVTVVTTGYQDHGRVITESTSPVPTPSGSVVSTVELTSFGAVARVWGASDPTRPAMEVEYDAFGRPSTTRGRGEAHRTHYDAFGRTVAIQRLDAGGASSSYLTYLYDRVDALRSVRDASGAEWLKTYDALGRLQMAQTPGGALETYVYRAGTEAPSLVLGPDGDSRALTYDTFGALRLAVGYRPTAPPGWSETRLEWLRDVSGVRVATSRNRHPDPSDDVILEYAYDSLGAPLSVSSSIFPGQPVSFEHDPVGRTDAVHSAVGSVFRSFDALGRISRIDLDGAMVAEALYTGAGPAAQVAFGNGAWTTSSYDEELRWLGDVTSSGAQPILQQSVHRDTRGQIARYDQSFGAAPARSALYLYDDFARLTSAAHGVPGLPAMPASGLDPSVVAAAMASASSSEDFLLDGADEWTLTRQGPVITQPAGGADHRLMDYGGAITSDQSGHQLQNAAGWQYGYDGLGRMVTATDPSTGVTYQLLNDAFGRLTKWSSSGTDGTSFQWIPGAILREHRAGDPGETLFVPGGAAGPIATRRGPTMHYNHAGLGLRLAAATDASGALAERYGYSAYGTPQIFDAGGAPRTTSAAGNRLLIGGQPHFVELGGLHRMVHRWYDPHLGHFLSRDPLGLVDGPNAYLYARGNPIMRVDPMGFASQSPEDGLRWLRGDLGNGDRERLRQLREGLGVPVRRDVLIGGTVGELERLPTGARWAPSREALRRGQFKYVVQLPDGGRGLVDSKGDADIDQGVVNGVAGGLSPREAEWNSTTAKMSGDIALIIGAYAPGPIVAGAAESSPGGIGTRMAAARAVPAVPGRVSGARSLGPTDWDAAEAAYEVIRSTDDVATVARNTGWPTHWVSRVKNHVFHNSHVLDDGVRRFDADPAIANAWHRLQAGTQTAADMQLLQDELFEAKFEGIFRTIYRTAHDAANRSGRPSGL